MREIRGGHKMERGMTLFLKMTATINERE
uniref:Uncharacterized protein n=1 Tax=Rhizophora mucronata TaxID=61149 RepID=A0A2P2KW59_RHIMU